LRFYPFRDQVALRKYSRELFLDGLIIPEPSETFLLFCKMGLPVFQVTLIYFVFFRRLDVSTSLPEVMFLEFRLPDLWRDWYILASGKYA